MSFGAGFSQGLSQVLSQGLPLIVNQRLQEQQLAQAEEELKLKKKAVQAQADHLAAQAQKTLREMLLQQALGEMIPGLPGASEPVPRTGALAEPEAAGIDPGQQLTPRGQLAQLLVAGGKTGDVLQLFPELTRESPEAAGARARATLDASGLSALLGGQVGPAAPADTGGALDLSRAAPGPGAPAGPAMSFRPTINLSADGKVSVSIAGQPTNFQVSTVDITDEQGFVQKHERVFDPTSGRVVNVYPIGPKVPPEFMQKAQAQVRAVLPDAPAEVQERAVGTLLGLEGAARTHFLAQLETENERLKALKSGEGGPSVRRAIEAARQEDVTRGAAKTAAETRARVENEPLQAADRTKMQMLMGVERGGQRVLELFNPAFVGKGFNAFSQRLQAEMSRQEQREQPGEGTYTPGGIAGAVREFFGQISPEEVEFRKTLLDVSDMLLRARSGAQINEQEYRRLKAILASLTDEPNVFVPAMQRFVRVSREQIDDLLTVATKPAAELRRGRARETPAASRPASKSPSQAEKPKGQTFTQTMILRGPNGQSGKLAPGFPVPEGWTVVGPHPGGK